MSPTAGTRALVTEVERKDRRFRTAQAIFLSLIFCILIGVVYVQLRTLAGVQEQLKQQAVLLEEQKKNTEDLKDTSAKVSRQLDCIAEFFATRDRSDAHITNLDQCTIVRPDGTIVAPTFSQGAAPTQTPTTDPQPQTQNSPQPISPDMPGLEPLNPQQPDPIIPPLPAPDRPPVEILGIPLCVPFTGVCVR